LLTLYRAAQEGLTNIQKHAGDCQVEVKLRFTQQGATLVICDTGRGFDSATFPQASPNGCYGLMGVRERLELVGGSLIIESAPGQGTTLRVDVPGQDDPLRAKENRR
jgi:signal transduction histidine kinase